MNSVREEHIPGRENRCVVLSLIFFPGPFVDSAGLPKDFSHFFELESELLGLNLTRMRMGMMKSHHSRSEGFWFLIPHVHVWDVMKEKKERKTVVLLQIVFVADSFSVYSLLILSHCIR